jgi:nucleoid-associated protein YgaU
VSLFRKLFIAGAIVGAGLGVATLLGEPASIKQALVAAGEGFQSPRSDASSPTLGLSTALASTNVQLVPESSVPAAAPSEGGSLSASIEPRLAPIISAAPPQFQSPETGRQFAGRSGEQNAPAARYELPPRARLRSEAPRPIGNEPRSPATIRRAPPRELGTAAAPSADRANQLTTGWPATATLPVGFAAADTPAVATPAVYDVPSESSNRPQVSPPPWPASGIGEGTRMHIIIDGDSLERLANRYLGDPRRGHDIYEMNRELLSNPDLLPIGAELKSPDRMARTSWDREVAVGRNDE